MPFPIIPVVATAGIGALSYLLFGKKDEASKGGGITPPQPSTPAQQQGASGAIPTPPGVPAPPPESKVIPPFVPGVMIPPGMLPPVKRPQDLPPPMPAPMPVIPPPMPNVLPPMPNVLPNILPPMPIPIIPPVPGPSLGTAVALGNPGVNIRSAPNTTAPVLMGVFNGQRVTVEGPLLPPTVGAPQGWYKVTSNTGIKGYSSAEFLRLDSSPSPQPAPIPVPPIPTPLVLTGTIKASPGANLRGSPSTNGAIIVGLVNGTKVRIVDPIPTPPNDGAPLGWLKIMGPAGQIGFVSAQYVVPDASPTTVTGENMYRSPRSRKNGYAVRG